MFCNRSGEQGNDALHQKIVLLTRKLEHVQAEYLQSREYLENQLDLANDKLQKVTDQYKQ